MSTMTTEPRVIAVTPNRYGDGFDSPNTIAVYSRYARGNVRLAVGYKGAGQSGRQEQGGPIIPGPWPYTFPLPTVIDNYGGTGREAAERIAAGTEYPVEIGDRFTIEGIVYVLTDDRPYDYPTLTPEETP